MIAPRASIPALLLLALTVTAVGPVAAEATRIVAVADFIDLTADGFLINAARLSGDLQLLLQEQGGDRLRVVPVDKVRAAMRARGYAPHDLISPSRAAEIAGIVGADWIATGRWLHLDVDVERRPNLIIVRAPATAVIEIRVLEASTRRVVLADTFSGFSPWALRLAARLALQRATERIVRL